MGASGDEDGGGIPLDCSVGTIVWVRRRNGSWWPGRILGPEELSASHLMSPRSGTPVKLLGREDASVDWYNLEKSKRVKPFRCGEFDACIERAEASQGAPIKKREKYARREDAILHALELEKKQLEMKQQKSGIVSNGVATRPLGLKKGNNLLSSDIITKNDYFASYSKYGVNKIRKSNPLHEDENKNNPMFLGNAKSGKVIGLEEDNTGTMPRMRGLQDFGLRIAPKKKALPSAEWETSKNTAEHKSNAFPSISGANHNKAMKGKRSSGITGDSLGKKRDRRRPLVQVLQSTAKLESSSTQLDNSPRNFPVQGEKDDVVVVCRAKRSRCIYLPADLNDSVQHDQFPFGEALMTQFETNNCFDDLGSLTKEHASSMINERDLVDSSETECLESDMEKGEKMDLLVGSEDCKPASVQHSDKINMDSFEMATSSDMNDMHPHEHSDDASPEVGVSKWHSKGKRNNRNFLKRPVDMTDGKTSVMSPEIYNGLLQDTTYGMKGNCSKRNEMELSSQWTMGHGSDHGKRSAHYASGMSDMVSEDSSQDEMTGYSKQRYPSLLKLAQDHGRSHKKYRDLEDDGRYPISRADWEESDDTMYTSYISKGRGPTLVDVDVKVERSYHGERVPLVSLMSRLNGKAIIGHPVQVEILEHGSTDHFFSGNCSGLDDTSTTQPVWRTARRTAMQRIPRSNPIASSVEGEEVGTLEFPERESKSLTENSGHQARIMKQSYLHSGKRPSSKYHKKSSKKASPSNQKTRALSSFAIERKLASASRDFKLTRSSDILGGLIKPEGTMPLVTCVPVKVAFSRILEAVGRPSLTTSHRVRMASPALRDDPC